MKQLKQLLLFISCLFLLPLVQGDGHSTASSAHERLVNAHTAVKTVLVAETHQRFSYRSKALNDFHEQIFFISSIRIKPLFVFIRSHYKGYSQSYISVAVSLNNWRGPPTA